MNTKHYALTLLCFLISSIGFAQDTLYVSPTGEGDGSSWQEASSDLFYILKRAKPGTEIWLTAGVYTPTYCSSCDLADRKMSFELKDGVNIYGGFTGNETRRDQAQSENPSILSGEIGDSTSRKDNSFSVVSCNGCGDRSTITNVTITKGYASNKLANSPAEKTIAGAGLTIFAKKDEVASPTFTNCKFIDNVALGRGGAVFINGSEAEINPTFKYCTFEKNSAFGEGGAIAIDILNSVGKIEINDSRLIKNQTIYSSTLGQAGGAIFSTCPGSILELNINETLIQGNKTGTSLGSAKYANTSANGGAIYSTNSNTGTVNITVTNSILDQNTAYAAGAVYNLGGIATFNNVSITRNIAEGSGGSGGGIYTNKGKSYIYNSILIDNEVTFNKYASPDLRFVNGTVEIAHSAVESKDFIELFSRAYVDNKDTLRVGNNVFYSPSQIVDYTKGFPSISSINSIAVNTGSTQYIKDCKEDYLHNFRVRKGTPDLGAIESPFGNMLYKISDFKIESIDSSISKIKLIWDVDSETDLEGYQVMKSSDGLEFEEIAFIPSMEKGRYSYFDYTIENNKTYTYKLLPVSTRGYLDNDIAVNSITTAFKAGSVKLISNIYPNPSNGKLKLELTEQRKTPLTYISVYNTQSTKVMFFTSLNESLVEKDLTSLSQGQYIIHVQNGADQDSSLFQIVK